MCIVVIISYIIYYINWRWDGHWKPDIQRVGRKLLIQSINTLVSVTNTLVELVNYLLASHGRSSVLPVDPSERHYATGG
jgi:hypothetical protein